MAEISKFNVNGTDYDLKDKIAREAVENIPNVAVEAVERYINDNPISGTVTEEQLRKTVEEYLKENPVTGGVSAEEIEAVVKEYLTANPPEAKITTEEIINAVNSYMSVNAEDFKGEPGENGTDGVSPTVEVEEVAGGYKVTITDSKGTKSFSVFDGEDGKDGKDGKDATGGSGTGGMTYYYKPLIIETTAGIYRKADGTIGDSTTEIDEYIKRVSATNADQYLPVTEGEVYRLSIGSIGAIPTSFGTTQCVFLDDDDNLVSNVWDTLNYKENVLVTVPENATRMHFTIWSGSNPKIEKQVAEPYGIVNEFELLNELKKIQHEQQTFERNTFAPFDKGYISFVNDDCRSSVGDIVDVFVNKGVPLCLASLHGAFNNLTSNDRTVLDVVRLAVANGGEVLAHNPTPITEVEIDDFTSLYEVFAKNKEMLEMYGFDVNGIILAGGTGQIVGSQKTDKWVRKYYQYSDLYGNAEYGYPYYHYRTALSNYTLDKAKAKVDDAITNKEWVIFYLHEWAEFSREDMESLLDYVKEKDRRELGIATYKQMYDNFCVKYPKQLVNITANKVTTVYEAGNVINTNDVTVKAYYDDGTTEEITNGIAVDLSEVNTATAGEYWCSVTYSGKTVYLPISIYASGDRTVLYSGKDGSYITWELYSDGVMEMTNTATWKQDITTYTADGGQPWAEHMSLIKKVKFNAGNYAISKIGDYAFYGATNLKEIDFSENTGGVTISQYAFGNCGLTTPTVEQVYKVDTNAFNGCPMTEITLNAEVISYNTFAGCDSLTVIRFVRDTMTIDGNAFYGVRGIVTDIYVPWAEGTVANAPWGATNATIHYNTTA